MTRKDDLIREIEEDDSGDVLIRYKHCRLLINKEVFIQMIKDTKTRNSQRLKKDSTERVDGMRAFAEWVEDNLEEWPHGKVLFSNVRDAYNSTFSHPSEHIKRPDVVRVLKEMYPDRLEDYRGRYSIEGYRLKGAVSPKVEDRTPVRPDTISAANYRRAGKACLQKFLASKGVRGVYTAEKWELLEIIETRLEELFD